jgi:hypothetical protein
MDGVFIAASHEKRSDVNHHSEKKKRSSCIINVVLDPQTILFGMHVCTLAEVYIQYKVPRY